MSEILRTTKIVSMSCGSGLNDLFFEFGDRCLCLGIFLLDWECLAIREDGASSSSSEDDEVQSSEGEEVEINVD